MSGTTRTERVPDHAGASPTDETTALHAQIAELLDQVNTLREEKLALEQAALKKSSEHDGALSASVRQSAFLAMLAHELRNPLAPISLASAMLANMPAPSAELLNLQTIIQRQVRHLGRLLDGMLDAASKPPVGQLDHLADTIRALPDEPAGDISDVVTAPLAWVPASNRRKVLIVEDNIDAMETLRLLLTGHGHTVVTAVDSKNGLAQARGHRFDVLICDIGLPGMDGLELIGELRKLPGPPIPIAIAISGFGQMHDRMRAIRAGFGQYFVKPVDVDALLTLVASDAASGLIATADRSRR
jgi:CheY-like chemotaxis protein